MIQRYDVGGYEFYVNKDPAGEYVQYDDHEAEVARLTAKCEAMQHVVNCASIFGGMADDDSIDDGEEEQEAMIALFEAIDDYRTALNQVQP